MNLSSLLHRTSRAYPDNIAIIEGDEQINYRELWERIEFLSNGFLAIGIKQGTNVAIVLPNCKEFIFCFFGLLRINAVAVPLKPSMTCWELGGMFKNCEPEAVVASPIMLNRMLSEAPGLVAGRKIIVRQGLKEEAILDKDGHLGKDATFTIATLMELGQTAGHEVAKVITPPKQLASINYTYRGYGYPLGAMLSHANYIHGAFNDIRHRKTSNKETHLLVLPAPHVLPLVGCIIVPLLAGAKVVVLNSFKANHIFQAISSNKVDILVLVPTIYYSLMKHYDKTKHDISSLRYGISGGSYMPVELNNEIKEKIGLDILQGYGLTECQPVTCDYLEIRRPATLGRLLHDVKIKIVDDKGSDCGVDETGEILIKTPQVMMGYYKNERDTMRVLEDGWLRTGDYGKVDKDGYVYFEKSKKDIKKINGKAIDITILKNIILSLRDIKDVKFDFKEDIVKGYNIITNAIVADTSNGLSPKDVKEVLRKHLNLGGQTLVVHLSNEKKLQ